MGQFFSAIATKDGRLLFTEEDSHEVIIVRAGLKDDQLFHSSWVRIEAIPSLNILRPSDIRVDETSTPAWYRENQEQWEDRIVDLGSRMISARVAYRLAVAPALANFDAMMDAERASGRSYSSIQESAGEAYMYATAPAQAAYVAQISTFEGYVPPLKGDLS